MTDTLDAIEARIGYQFKTRDWLERALTHASYGDGRRIGPDNERLEFLGDRVLGLLVAERLFQVFDKADEGGLHTRLNALVRKEACADVARAVDLGAALRVSKSVERGGGRDRDGILGDACEALLAAIYLDGGMTKARAFFNRFWGEDLKALAKPPQDSKNTLQEWAAKIGHAHPVYRLVSRSGPDHRPRFLVEVQVDPLAPAQGSGGSKQQAEYAAAHALLTREGVHV